MAVRPETKVLHFQLFGTPSVSYEGKEFEIPRKNVRMLAYYLACQSEPGARKDLMMLLWPDTNEEKSTANLREHLSKLRSSLPDKNLLQSKRDLVFFDPARTSCDVMIYQQEAGRLIEQLTRFSSSSPLPEQLLDELEAVISIWQSKEFLTLSGYPKSEIFEQWLSETRNKLEITHGILVERTAEAFLNMRNLHKAIDYLNKIVSIDNLNPMLHYRLIKLLLDAQQYTIARSYCDYVEELAENAGLDLDTSILADIVREVKEEKTLFNSDEEHKWQQIFHYQIPFVGQANAFEKLRSNLDKGIFLFRGEIGAGRSRMAYEFYRRFLTDHRPMQMESHHFEELLPYAAIVDLLEDHFTKEEWEQVPLSELGWLTLQFPVILSKFSNIPHPPRIPPADFHQHILHALQTIFEVAAKEKPLCLVFDDIEHCDNASLQIIHHLIDNQFFPHHGVLMMTAGTQFLQTAKAHFLGLDYIHFCDYHLEPLSSQDFNQILNTLVGHPVSETVTEKLVIETNGNPLMGLSVIVDAVGKNMETFENIEQILIQQNSSFPLWVQQQMELLSDDSKKILGYCALMGNHFTHRQLEMALKEDPATINRSMKELEEKKIISPQREKDIHYGYGFTHPLLKNQILSQIDTSQKRVYALQIIDAYQQAFGRSQERIASILAEHYLSAGEAKMAWEQFIIAASYAEKNYAPADSNESFTNAEKLLPKLLPRLEDEEIAKFYTHWVQNRIAFNLHGEGHIHAKSLLRIGEQQHSHFLMGIAFLLIGLSKTSDQQSTNSQLADFDQAIAYLTQCTLCESLLQSKTEKALALVRMDRLTESKKLITEVLDSIRNLQADTPWLKYVKLRADYVYAFLLAQAADCAKALQILEENSQVLLTSSDSLQVADFFLLHAWLRANLGDLQAAAVEYKNVIDIARQLNHTTYLSSALEALGRVKFIMGEIDQAWQMADEAIELAAANKISHIAASASALKGVILSAFSENDRARAAFLQGIAFAKQHHNPFHLGSIAAYLAMIEVNSGQFNENWQILRALIDDFKQNEKHLLRLQTSIGLYYQCVILDPLEEYSGPIGQEIKWLLQEVEEKGLALLTFYARLILAIYSHNHGNDTLAMNLFHQCFRQCIDLKMNVFEIISYQHLGEISRELSLPGQERMEYLMNELNGKILHPEIASYKNSFLQNHQLLVCFP